MSEEEIKRTNMKLMVFDTFPYKRLREVCDKIQELGFDCKYCENGNIVFTDTTESEDKVRD